MDLFQLLSNTRAKVRAKDRDRAKRCDTCASEHGRKFSSYRIAMIMTLDQWHVPDMSTNTIHMIPTRLFIMSLCHVHLISSRLRASRTLWSLRCNKEKRSSFIERRVLCIQLRAICSLFRMKKRHDGPSRSVNR